MRRTTQTSGHGAPGAGEKLQAEADRLHRVLFGGGAPEEVKRQYAAALETMPITVTPEIETLLESGVDLEAMELALRKKDPLNPLTQRFRVLCYLVEARPEYFDRFVAERRRSLAGVIALTIATLRTVYKAIKGRHLARKHGVG